MFKIDFEGFKYGIPSSNDADLGGNGDSLIFRSKPNESLLLSVRADKGVDRARSNSEDVLECTLDLNLVGSVVGKEGEGVSLGHSLVSLLSIEWLHQNGVFIEFGRQLERCGGSQVFGLGCLTKSVRLVETQCGSDTVLSSLDTLAS